MKRLFFCCTLLLYVFCLYGQEKLIWEIGVQDQNYAEFDLSKETYKDFIKKGYGKLENCFVVGMSNPKQDWPFILPGSMDGFIGYGEWAGHALCKLPLYFQVEKKPQDGTCRLQVSFYEVSDQRPPLFRVFVNGVKFEKQLLKGKSGRNPRDAEKNIQIVDFSFPTSLLRDGLNEIIFQNHLGNWSIFDAISLFGPNSLSIGKTGQVLIKEIKIADFESQSNHVSVQPLLIDILNLGEKIKLNISVDNQAFVKEIEHGHHVIELNLPAVQNQTESIVKVYRKKDLLAQKKIVRYQQPTVELVDYVDQFIGTSGSRWMIAPGPWMPMGMVKLSPDNQHFGFKGGYEYQIENIMGFSHIHEWTMAGLLMMPCNGPLHIQPGPENHPDWGYRSRIDKSTEKAQVGLYSVDLTDYHIHVDLTATTRATMQRYIFPADRENRVLIDLHFPGEYLWDLRDAKITKVSDTELEGWALSRQNKIAQPGQNDYKLHFVIQFDKPFINMGGWIQDVISEDVDEINRSSYSPRWSHFLKDDPVIDAGAFVNFPERTTEVKIRTGISLVSIENARLNLEEEIVKPFGWNFEEVVQNQRQTWNQCLGRVEIETDDYLQKVKFYTNLYRAVSGRTTWSDVNGEWMDMNEEKQCSNPSKPLYGSDSFWGWHWNLVPLYNLLYPEISSNWINTFLEMYKVGGWIPIGNPGLEYYRVMCGQPAIPLIVSAYQHGIRDFDTSLMMKALYHQQTALMVKHPGGGEVGNESYKYYLERGYVPLNKDYHSNASNTLEYAFQDWCFAQFAKSLKVDTVYTQFMKRSDNWKNMFDQTIGFARPRTLDGEWLEDYDPFLSPGFTEANGWQYTWHVPHDVDGLVKIMGRQRFVDRLNKGMETSSKADFNALGDNFRDYPVNHGNQPNMQSSYLFNYAGEPWLTQKWTREIQEKYYGIGVRDAYPGDEDQGQMSAWYVLSCIGLFQMDGGCNSQPAYELGSPRFQKVKIHLNNTYYSGKTFEIIAPKASSDNRYIKSVKLNGKKYSNWKIPSKMILQGGKLEIEMDDKPSSWGKTTIE